MSASLFREVLSEGDHQAANRSTRDKRPRAIVGFAYLLLSATLGLTAAIFGFRSYVHSHRGRTAPAFEQYFEAKEKHQRATPDNAPHFDGNRIDSPSAWALPDTYIAIVWALLAGAMMVLLGWTKPDFYRW